MSSIKDFILKDLNPNKNEISVNLDNSYLAKYEESYVKDIENMLIKISEGYIKFCYDSNLIHISMSDSFDPPLPRHAMWRFPV